MLNFKEFVKNFDQNLMELNSRGKNYTSTLCYLKELWMLKKTILIQLNTLQSFVNQFSQKFHLSFEMKLQQKKLSFLKQVIQILKAVVNLVENDFTQKLLTIPNLPTSDVPYGLTAKQNVVVFINNITKKKPVISHWQIMQKLGWGENIQAVKMAKTRFVVYRNQGAQLVRILQSFMLDYHRRKGYCELITPYLVKEQALLGTGQFPKMRADAFQIVDQDLFLIPTSEVSLVNFFARSLLPLTKLPEKVCSYSPCFRQEAGAAGTETSGLLRMHQFHKVELVKITDVTTSNDELESMVSDVQGILDLLKLPYQRVKLCRGELGFSASKTYDLEVWLPSLQKYVEVASLSNTGDFQTNYLQIKYKDEKGQKHFAHALNGSGLAIDRLFACLLENYYDDEQNVFVYPHALQKYQQFFQN